jgi:hypothetical protein
LDLDAFPSDGLRVLIVIRPASARPRGCKRIGSGSFDSGRFADVPRRFVERRCRRRYEPIRQAEKGLLNATRTRRSIGRPGFHFSPRLALRDKMNRPD